MQRFSALLLCHQRNHQSLLSDETVCCFPLGFECTAVAATARHSHSGPTYPRSQSRNRRSEEAFPHFRRLTSVSRAVSREKGSSHLETSTRVSTFVTASPTSGTAVRGEALPNKHTTLIPCGHFITTVLIPREQYITTPRDKTNTL